MNAEPRSIEVELEERRKLAAEIVAVSDPMPDPQLHMLWLLGLKTKSLQERLTTIKAQRSWRTATRRTAVGRTVTGASFGLPDSALAMKVAA